VALLENGEPSPTAESIAAKAGVSLRTVFRHFEEMENLHLEIAGMVFERIRPMLEQPLEQTQWPAVLFESVSRRAKLFEAIAPYKTAMDVHRHRSRLVADKHRRVAELSRDFAAACMPDEVKRDPQLVELLNLVLSIESWQRLREQQGLSAVEAEAAVNRAAAAIAGVAAPAA
jgi:AcrR family transcriptional regulator